MEGGQSGSNQEEQPSSSNPQPVDPRAEALVARGNELYGQGRFAEAIEIYKQALEFYRDYPETQNNWGSALFSLGQYKEAAECFDRAVQLKPDYVEARRNRGVTLQELAQQRPPTKTDSSGRDLVFYCGPSDEVWNPEVARAQGIGGSEEAVIWLSRLLHQRGWNVTVYADCGPEQDYDGVQWKPYTLWNHRDRQDATVLWRYPQLIQYNFNSARLFLDLHDTFTDAELTPDRAARLDRIFVKSKFHRSLFPSIPDEKFAVLPNGIDAELFSAASERDPLLLINTSSADRSISAFVDCFTEIKKQVPLAKAQWAYGWSVWDFNAEFYAPRSEWKTRIQQRMKEVGIEELGRLSHPEIAALYRRANIFAYPSEYAEIDCISLSKAMAAGAIPITTDFAALGEKAGHGGVFLHSAKTKDNFALPGQLDYAMTDPEQKAAFVREAVKLLKEPPAEQAREPMRQWARSTYDWNHVADQWHQVLTSPAFSADVDEQRAKPDNAETASSIDSAPAARMSRKERMKQKHKKRAGQTNGQPENPSGANVDALFQSAREHHAAGRLQQAEALYRQALQIAPAHADTLHLLGVLAYQAGHAPQAVELIDKALQSRPNFAEARFSRGNARFALQQYGAAVEDYDQAIQLHPLYAEAYCNRASALRLLQQYDAAIDSYDNAIQLKPDYLDAHANRAATLYTAGRFEAALESFDQVLLLRPDFVETHFNRGAALHALGRYQEAVDSFTRAVQLRPEYAEAHVYRGNSLQVLGRHVDALECYDVAIRLKPDFAEAHSNRGTALFSQERYAEGVESFDRAIALKPEYIDPHSNRGAALHALKQYESSLESCDRALRLNPQFADALCNRANALHGLERYEEALASYDAGLRLNPHLAKARNNRGGTLLALERYAEALESYDAAIQINPEYADAYCNRGNALQFLKLDELALESYDRSIQLKPVNPDAHYNRGNILQIMKQYEAALGSYQKAAAANPQHEYVRGMQLHMHRFMGDWDGIDEELRQLEAAIERGETAIVPFQSLSVGLSPALQRRVAEIHVQHKFPQRASAHDIPRRPRRDKIRIGYYSADYRNHATTYLIAELLERHDRNRFEVFGFSFGPHVEDEMSRRVSSAMDRFLEVQSLTDREIAHMSRDFEVDIAVDLKGFTHECRTGIFAHRAAPIQVSYLGYPGTMGAEYIDYLIADPTLIPEASRQHYAEKIVYLPDSYQVNDTQRMISAKAYARAAEGLPETGFVYCCFNNAYKISPSVFDSWMRILQRVPGSVLWLLEENPWIAANLRKEAAHRGVTPERLVFAKPLPMSEHLARQALADLFLDTLPYNAHTTASDALWAGLPVLTRMGDTFAGRVAASLLRAIDLPELVTTSVSDFEDLAVALAQDPERHKALRKKLEANRLRTALFDIEAFAAHLEAAYTAMYEQHLTGQQPEHIEVPRLPR